RAPEAGLERGRVRGRERSGLAPRGRERLHLVREVRDRLLPAGRDERFELGAERFARRLLRLARDRVPPLVALVEGVARGPEALPERLGPRLLHGPDRLPFGLEPFHLGEPRLPVR